MLPPEQEPAQCSADVASNKLNRWKSALNDTQTGCGTRPDERRPALAAKIFCAALSKQNMGRSSARGWDLASLNRRGKAMTLEERIMHAYAKSRPLSEVQADIARKEIARIIQEMTVAGQIQPNVGEK